MRGFAHTLIKATINACANKAGSTNAGYPMRRTLTSLAVLLNISLAGCVPTAKPIDHAADFRAEGKLAARSSQGSESAQFVWQQFGETFDITVAGPAGLKAARLSGDDRSARFRQGEIDISANSADDLAERLLGFPAPASSMRYWIVGEADPNHTARNQQRDSQGRLINFEQQQWQVELGNFQTVNGRDLPGRVRATQRVGQVTFVIKNWQYNAGLPSSKQP